MEEILSKKPYLHDKLEFDVAITCFSFDIKDKAKKHLPKNLKKKNIIKFINYHKENFKSYFNKNSASSLDSIEKKINLLEKKQEKYKKVKSLKDSIFMIKIIIDDCINLGAIPFAQAARHAFIAKSILNSLQNKKIIKKQKLNNFESSINTITTEFLKDINLVYLKKISKNFFFISMAI